MVKGVSKQVIIMRPGESALFEQAIFILKENAVGSQGITDRQLLQEANLLLHSSRKKPSLWQYGTLWAMVGGLTVGIIWAVTYFLSVA